MAGVHGVPSSAGAGDSLGSSRLPARRRDSAPLLPVPTLHRRVWLLRASVPPSLPPSSPLAGGLAPLAPATVAAAAPPCEGETLPRGAPLPVLGRAPLGCEEVARSRRVAGLALRAHRPLPRAADAGPSILGPAPCPKPTEPPRSIWLPYGLSRPSSPHPAAAVPPLPKRSPVPPHPPPCSTRLLVLPRRRPPARIPPRPPPSPVRWLRP